MPALSDILPALSSKAERSFWIPDALAPDAYAAADSLRMSYDGEGLLETSPVTTLIYIGPGSAARAANYLTGRAGAKCLLFHPDPTTREVQAALFDSNPNFEVVASIDNLPLEPGTSVNVLIDVSCFELALIEIIARQCRIDWLVGAFESARYPTAAVYQTLKRLAQNFRLRDATLHTLISAAPSDAVDISIFTIVTGKTLVDLCVALATDWPIKFDLHLIPDGLSAIDRLALDQLVKRHPQLNLLETKSENLSSRLKVALDAVKGRYVTFFNNSDSFDLSKAVQMFDAATICNVDVLLAAEGPIRSADQVVLGVARLNDDGIPEAVVSATSATFRTNFLKFYEIWPDPSCGDGMLSALCGSCAVLGGEFAKIAFAGTPFVGNLTPAERDHVVHTIVTRADMLGTVHASTLASATVVAFLCRHRPVDQQERHAYDIQASCTVNKVNLETNFRTFTSGPTAK